MSLTPPTDFTIQLTMTSDWHIGSGAGRGEIDSVIQRDSDDMPYIPAKTLTGILRDGCEQVAQALDESDRGRWNNWVNFLFGDQPILLDPGKDQDQEKLELQPRPAVLEVRSAHLDLSLKSALSTGPLKRAVRQAEEEGDTDAQQRLAARLKLKRQLNNAIAFTKPGVSIDPETGSAKPDFFRIEEVVRMDAYLVAESCRFDFSETPNISENQKKAAYALLLAGAKMVNRLGGKRRRGNGSCAIKIDSSQEEWILWLKNHYKEVGNPPEWKPPQLSLTQSGSFELDTHWYSIPLVITTQAPTILPARTVGNVVECLDYIPGRYLLPLLHKKLGRKFDVSQAIAYGNVVLTNATVAIDDKASRPTPFCLFGEKLSGGIRKGKGVYNRFQEEEPEGVQIKSERSGYLGSFNGSQLPKYNSVSLKLYTHNTIRDDVQRPTSDVGGVYSYQDIAPETTLVAELRLPKRIKEHLDGQSESWWSDLSCNIRIGQSKKDQYGSIEVEAKQPKLFSAQQASDTLLYVWFLSDVLLRDERLAATTNPDSFTRALEKELELEEGALTERKHKQLLSCMMRSRRTESWQVRWGLPRPTMLGWQAGSCVVYEVEGEIKPEKLAELEAKGIGDRCAEGYGQICFNDSLLTSPLGELKRKPPELKAGSTDFDLIVRNNSSFSYARMIEQAAWREVIQNRALAIAASAGRREEILGIRILGEPPESQPSMSQLGGLRSAIMRLQSFAKDDKQKVTGWLDALENIDNRREKWEATNDGLQRIRDLVTSSELIWAQLDIDWESLVITTHGVPELKEALWAETIRILVDAIIRAHKRDWENAIDAQSKSEEAA